MAKLKEAKITINNLYKIEQFISARLSARLSACLCEACDQISPKMRCFFCRPTKIYAGRVCAEVTLPALRLLI